MDMDGGSHAPPAGPNFFRIYVLPFHFNRGQALAWNQAYTRDSPPAGPQQDQQPGEVRFSADNQEERDSGISVDGKYFGYVKELKGNKKVLLAPGEHEISIRQDGYKDFDQKIVVEAGQAQTVNVMMEENPKAIYPGDDAAELRLDIQPKRAAVFLDDAYVGHGGDFGGRFHSMLVSPGKHQLKVTLSGYRAYQMEINPVAYEKSRMKIVLEKEGASGQ